MDKELREKLSCIELAVLEIKELLAILALHGMSPTEATILFRDRLRNSIIPTVEDERTVTAAIREELSADEEWSDE